MIEYRVIRTTPKKSPYFAKNNSGNEDDSDLLDSDIQGKANPGKNSKSQSNYIIFNIKGKFVSPKASKKAIVKVKRKVSVVKPKINVPNDDSSESQESFQDQIGDNNVASKGTVESESQSDILSPNHRVEKNQLISSDDKSDMNVVEYTGMQNLLQHQHNEISCRKWGVSHEEDYYGGKNVESYVQSQYKKTDKTHASRGEFQSPEFVIVKQHLSKSMDLVCKERGKEVASNTSSNSSFDKYEYRHRYISKAEQTSSKRTWTHVDTDISSDDQIDHEPNRKFPMINYSKTSKKDKIERHYTPTSHQTS